MECSTAPDVSPLCDVIDCKIAQPYPAAVLWRESVCWVFVTPPCLLIVVIYSQLRFQEITFGLVNDTKAEATPVATPIPLQTPSDAQPAFFQLQVDRLSFIIFHCSLSVLCRHPARCGQLWCGVGIPPCFCPR